MYSRREFGQVALSFVVFVPLPSAASVEEGQRD
jgi:hypothetical protein